MPAVDYNITIEQGATFKQKFVWRDVNCQPIDLTNYEARMQIRSGSNCETLQISLDSAGNGIELGTTDGVIQITIDAIATAAIPLVKSARYDLEMVNVDDTVTRLLQGAVIISAEVTR